MNKIALFAAAAASFATLAVAPAFAEAATVSVSYGDLDLSTPSGHDVLAKRIEASAEVVCGRPDIREVKAMSEFQGCKAAAVSSAVEQLSRAGVTDAAEALAND